MNKINDIKNMSGLAVERFESVLVGFRKKVPLTVGGPASLLTNSFTLIRLE